MATESPFELAGCVTDGLKLLNNKINEEITKKLIVNAVKQLLIKGPGNQIFKLFLISCIFNKQLLSVALPARPEIYDSPVGLEAKQADFAVSSILLLAAQHSTDLISLRQLLDRHKINNQTVEQLVESYEKFQNEITARLAKQGYSHNIPELTSVSVEIQQKIPSNELVYKINLQSFDHKSGRDKTIQEMFCNQEELQSLINKLKDIERHCEKISK